MTNEELKKKLAEIINEWHKFQKRDAHGNTIWQTNDAEKLANAFISAGIGDVKEAEHRAEVAERAVENLVRARNYLAAQIYIEVENGDALPVDYYMRQAERQLAKEEEK